MSLALLVDPDAGTRQMYAAYLQRSIGDVDEAEDGREALAKALTRHPDVIVTETRLPGINGFDLCRLLRDDTTTRDMVIVFVTGDAFDMDVQRAQKAGADTVLTKPCLPERLAVEISRLMTKTEEHRDRARTAINRVQLMKARDPIGRSKANRFRRKNLSRAHVRRDTATPAPPPAVVCPTCDRPLKYMRSHVGGASIKHHEQWDYYECSGGCGTFQYRQRTRKIRRVV